MKVLDRMICDDCHAGDCEKCENSPGLLWSACECWKQHHHPGEHVVYPGREALATPNVSLRGQQTDDDYETFW
jgi:hypothetical protein